MAVRGGEGGIRTPGGLPLNGFQDRRFRPLSHLSGGVRDRVARRESLPTCNVADTERAHNPLNGNPNTPITRNNVRVCALDFPARSGILAHNSGFAPTCDVNIALGG